MLGGFGCPITAENGQKTFLGLKYALKNTLFNSKNIKLPNWNSGFSVQLVMFVDCKFGLKNTTTESCYRKLSAAIFLPHGATSTKVSCEFVLAYMRTQQMQSSPSSSNLSFSVSNL
jgi:hypothetical protein